MALIYVSKDDNEQNTSLFDLECRFAAAKAVAGIRCHHAFTPLSISEMEMRQISADSTCSSVHVGTQNAFAVQNPDEPILSQDNSGSYVVCIYDTLASIYILL